LFQPADPVSPDLLAEWVCKRAATDNSLRRDLGRLVMQYGGDRSLAVMAPMAMKMMKSTNNTAKSVTCSILLVLSFEANK
jgi:hypothetical protein